jgi:hypothetical protein
LKYNIKRKFSYSFEKFFFLDFNNKSKNNQMEASDYLVKASDYLVETPYYDYDSPFTSTIAITDVRDNKKDIFITKIANMKYATKKNLESNNYRISINSYIVFGIIFLFSVFVLWRLICKKSKYFLFLKYDSLS